MPRQTELANWLIKAGLDVVETDDWKLRGNVSFNPGGVVCHHTADGAGEIPSLRILIHGRSDLPGPLCQIGLARSGTCYVVAAGRANHAGRGGWKGMVGNSAMWGIEAENRGGYADPWPSKQLDAYYALAAVLQTHTVHGPDVQYICGHKEWTSRKPDPHSIVMNEFRSQVARILVGEEDDLAKVSQEEWEEVKTQVAEMWKANGDRVGKKYVGVLEDINPTLGAYLKAMEQRIIDELKSK